MVGFIGLGIMGGPMALNLLRADIPLMVYDINEAAVERLASRGAIRGDLKQIGLNCGVIFTILTDGAAVREVLFRENGVASAVRPGAVICDMSSVTPGESRDCCAKLKKIGVAFVDSPVSGGEPKAIDGTLAFMAGGEQEHFDLLKPYFDMMGSSALLVGPSGSGSVAKLANQVIVNLTIATVSEAFVLAVKAGAEPEKVYEAIRGGLAGSAVLDSKLPMMLDRSFVPGGKISINHKDIKNVLATAHEVDAPVPLTAQLFEIMQSLKAAGHMNDDHSGIVRYFEQLAGTEVKRRNKT